MFPVASWNLRLAGCVSVLAHVTALAIISPPLVGLDSQPSRPRLDVTLEAPPPSAPPLPTVAPAPPPEVATEPNISLESQDAPPLLQPAPPVVEPPLPPPPPDYPPSSSLSRQASLISPVDEAAWPRFPQLGNGSFQLELIIGSDGRVAAITPRCPPLLCEAANAYAEIVRQWQFVPAELEDVPVAVRLRIEFELNPQHKDLPPPGPQPPRQ